MFLPTLRKGKWWKMFKISKSDWCTYYWIEWKGLQREGTWPDIAFPSVPISWTGRSIVLVRSFVIQLLFYFYCRPLWCRLSSLRRRKRKGRKRRRLQLLEMTRIWTRLRRRCLNRTRAAKARKRRKNERLRIQKMVITHGKPALAFGKVPDGKLMRSHNRAW